MLAIVPASLYAGKNTLMLGRLVIGSLLGFGIQLRSPRLPDYLIAPGRHIVDGVKGVSQGVVKRYESHAQRLVPFQHFVQEIGGELIRSNHQYVRNIAAGELLGRG